MFVSMKAFGSDDDVDVAVIYIWRITNLCCSLSLPLSLFHESLLISDIFAFSLWNCTQAFVHL